MCREIYVVFGFCSMCIFAKGSYLHKSFHFEDFSTVTIDYFDHSFYCSSSLYQSCSWFPFTLPIFSVLGRVGHAMKSQNNQFYWMKNHCNFICIGLFCDWVIGEIIIFPTFINYNGAFLIVLNSILKSLNCTMMALLLNLQHLSEIQAYFNSTQIALSKIFFFWYSLGITMFVKSIKWLLEKKCLRKSQCTEFELG